MTATNANPTSHTEMVDRILDIVASEGMIERARVAPDVVLDSLDVASADLMMILMAIEEEYGVYIPVDESLSEAKTVGELINAITSHIEEERGQTSS